MSSNSSDEIFIAHLSFLASQINRYLSIAILLFGTIGNVLNCLALSQRTLRSNPCAAFFLASSVANVIALISGAMVRLLAGWRADLTETISWICKIRIFVLYTSRTIAPWLIMMATVDRWLSSSKNGRLRQMSSLKNAQYVILFVTMLSFALHSQIFYCVEANLINNPVRCNAKDSICQNFLDMSLIFIIVIIPSVLMFIFGLMTVRNIRDARLQRMKPLPSNMMSSAMMTNTHGKMNSSKRTDRYLLKMLWMQVIFLTLFSLPQAMHNAYSAIIRGQPRSALHNAWSSFTLNVFFLLTYVTNGMPFYIYTLLGGEIFRQALRNSFENIHSYFH